MRRERKWKRLVPVMCLVVLAWAVCRAAAPEGDGAKAFGPEKVFRAGAYAIDITPRKFPVIVNGGFQEQTADRAHDPLHARCLVLDDGTVRLAIVVVDNCLMPRELLDEAKELAHRATGISTDRMLISATHTHSAPSVMGALGTDADPEYSRFLPPLIAKGIEEAVKNLVPAKVGWAVVQDTEHTHCRRWILRPDRIRSDPFGQATVRAMMHPGHQNPDFLGPAGPVDPNLTVLSVQSRTGAPIAVLANYSMHYFGAPPLSADYYGRFAEKLKRMIGAESISPPFVGIMSQGTSGDLQWMDYGQPPAQKSMDSFAEEIALVAFEAYRKIEYHERVPIEMREKKLTLKFRLPDESRTAWAKQIVAEMQGRKPKTLPEIYAREQLFLIERPTSELKIQALRIGDMGIAAIPCEVFGITGLKIKAQSSLVPTFVVELANGAEGYIPPPEQHKLGGYTAWPARSAGLEVEAEPKIVETVLGLLEEVSGRPRRMAIETQGPYAKAVLSSKPVAYWRMGELSGRRAVDATQSSDGEYEDGIALYLDGPASPRFSGEGQVNRCPHFAGGRMKAMLENLGSTYSVELWFYNCLLVNARPVTGYIFSRGADGAEGAPGDHLAIGGTHSSTGKLVFFNGNALNQALSGTTEIPVKTWNHVVIVRDGKRVTVYLNGQSKPEISGEAEIGFASGVKQVFVGGRNDNFANFEGKIDEIAVYGRALSAKEAAGHYRAAGLKEGPVVQRQASDLSGVLQFWQHGPDESAWTRSSAKAGSGRNRSSGGGPRAEARV